MVYVYHRDIIYAYRVTTRVHTIHYIHMCNNKDTVQLLSIIIFIFKNIVVMYSTVLCIIEYKESSFKKDKSYF